MIKVSFLPTPPRSFYFPSHPNPHTFLFSLSLEYKQALKNNNKIRSHTHTHTQEHKKHIQMWKHRFTYTEISWKHKTGSFTQRTCRVKKREKKCLNKKIKSLDTLWDKEPPKVRLSLFALGVGVQPTLRESFVSAVRLPWRKLNFHLQGVSNWS